MDFQQNRNPRRSCRSPGSHAGDRCGGNATVLLTSIYQSIADYFAVGAVLQPSGNARTWSARDEVFEGPLLEQGFIDPDEMAKMERRSTVRISDLIRVLMAVRVPGIVAVKNLHFLVNGEPSKDWLLNIDPKLTARFDLDHSDIRLERRGLHCERGHSAYRAEVVQLACQGRRKLRPGPRRRSETCARQWAVIVQQSRTILPFRNTFR